VDLPSSPEPPVVREIGTTSCTVTYRPPEHDGGAPVTGYILERRTPGPDSEWIRVDESLIAGKQYQYTIDNLTPATEYEFRVSAENMKGTSDESLQSQSVWTKVIYILSIC